MQYTKKTFTVPLGSDAYRANYEAVFGKKESDGDYHRRLLAMSRDEFNALTLDERLRFHDIAARIGRELRAQWRREDEQAKEPK